MTTQELVLEIKHDVRILIDENVRLKEENKQLRDKLFTSREDHIKSIDVGINIAKIANENGDKNQKRISTLCDLLKNTIHLICWAQGLLSFSNVPHWEWEQKVMNFEVELNEVLKNENVG